MRKLKRLAAVAVLALTLAPIAAAAGGVILNPVVRFEFTDCAAAGSASQTIFAGSYLMRVTTEDVFICYAATCAAGGEKFPAGMVLLVAFQANQQVSCRSAASTGDLILTNGS